MKIKLTSADIEYAVANWFGWRQNLIVPNVSWGLGLHECDLLVCSKSGYLTEVEIKVSKSDLIKDKEKRHGHNNQRIKALYFAIPDYLYTEEIIAHIPERAGILMIRHNGKRLVVLEEREPQKSRGIALTDRERYEMGRLGTMRVWGLKHTVIANKNTINHLREELTKYKGAVE